MIRIPSIKEIEEKYDVDYWISHPDEVIRDFNMIPESLFNKIQFIEKIAEHTLQLEYIPSRLWSQWLIELYSKDPDCKISYIPKPCRTFDVLKNILTPENTHSYRGLNLKFLEPDELTNQIKKFLEHDEDRLNLYRLRKFTHIDDIDMLHTLIRNECINLDEIPWDLRDELVCRSCLKYKSYLSVVPWKLRDKEMCILALENLWQNAPFVPPELRSDPDIQETYLKTYDEHVLQTRTGLSFFIKEFGTEEFFLKAIKQDPENISYIDITKYPNVYKEWKKLYKYNDNEIEDIKCTIQKIDNLEKEILYLLDEIKSLSTILKLKN